MRKPRKGDRYLNHLGEYCFIKHVYNQLVYIQICGKNNRGETWKMKDFLNHMAFTFWEVPFPKTNRTNVAQHLLEYQLNMIGKTSADTKKNENWFKEWTITDSDYKLFAPYAIKLLKKVFKFNRTKAQDTFDWWWMHFGLEIVKDRRK